MAMAITDLFINRAINAFIKCLVFMNLSLEILKVKFIKYLDTDNSVDVMLKNIIFLFLIYCMVYILALVIEIIFIIEMN